MDLAFTQTPFLSRHLVNFSAINHSHNSGFASTVQPDAVGKVGGAHGSHTFSVRAMAACTDRKFLLALCCTRSVVLAF